MRRMALIALLLFSGHALGQSPSQRIVLLGQPSGCVPYQQFLARTSGLDTKHQTAYRTLICTLASTSVWAKLDVLYTFATQTTTIARLNLKSTSFTGLLVSAPTFTVDKGYNGTPGYINSTYTPSTAGGNWTISNAAVFVWSLTATPNTGAGSYFGCSGTGTAVLMFMNSTTQAATRLDAATGQTYNWTGDGTGFFLIERNGAASELAFRNDVSLGIGTTASVAIADCSVAFGSDAAFGDPSKAQIAIGGMGAALSTAEGTILYNAVQAYLKAVGAI